MKTLILLALAVPLAAQEPLALKDAVKLALEKHPSITASQSGVQAAGARIAEARGGYLPKVSYAESFLRSDNPVVVFSSLLTQHQFKMENFALGPLNRPDALNNFQSQVTVDEVVYDAGQTRNGIRSAELGRNISAEDERRVRMNAVASVARAYDGAVLAEAAVKVAAEAVRSAEADLSRAESVRAAGMATDADVLSIRVHLAAASEQQITRAADLEVAFAALNEALGLPLSQPHTLTTPLTAAPQLRDGLEESEKDASGSRPELRQARLAANLAETQVAASRSAFLPQVFFHGGFEADRQRVFSRGGASWLVSGSLRWNLFNGGADKARSEEAAYGLQRARALAATADGQVRLQVRQAWANLRAATQRIDVAEAAVSMAEESLRITKNRYDAGLSNVTDLLRTETALLEARNRRLAAIYDQRMAAVGLALATGSLTENSEVLN